MKPTIQRRVIVAGQSFTGHLANRVDESAPSIAKLRWGDNGKCHTLSLGNAGCRGIRAGSLQKANGDACLPDPGNVGIVVGSRRLVWPNSQRRKIAACGPNHFPFAQAKSPLTGRVEV